MTCGDDGMVSKLRVTKLEAARRQLEGAVRLYFADDDPVAIHTLTCAAYQVLVDINQARGGTPTLKEQIVTWYKPEQQKRVFGILNAAANFFKHADKDPNPDGTHELLTTQTDLLLFDACAKCEEMVGEIIPPLQAYRQWFWMGPIGTKLANEKQSPVIERVRQAFPDSDRRKFFGEALAILKELKDEATIT
jgi:hypothetical protein